jgi:exosortase
VTKPSGSTWARNWREWIAPCARRLREEARTPRGKGVGLLLLFGLGLLWAYAPTLAGMVQRWSSDPQYSHGFLVPVFAGIVLWVRSPQHPGVALSPSWWGLLWLLLAAGLRLVSAAFYLEWLDALSLLPALAGLCVLLGGRPALRWAWPAIGFLVFMMPMPYQLEIALAHPLQRVATAASTYLLQTFGLPAVAEGNIIHIDDVKLGVVEACSGLGMLVTFFALSTAVALVLARGWTDRIVLFLSAIPVALAANVFRITLTGLLHATAGGAVARVVYHDLAGWLMMPLALALLWVELKFLAKLFIDEAPPGPLPLDLSPAATERRTPPHGSPGVPDPEQRLGVPRERLGTSDLSLTARGTGPEQRGTNHEPPATNN